MRIVFVGLSITSSWGNGHATNYRALVDELAARGHDVMFCERDVPWYAAHRDLPALPAGRLCLYRDLADLRRRSRRDIAAADLVILGSYVPEGAEVAAWLLSAAAGPVAFYDIDTPVTLGMLARGEREYVSAEVLPRFALYLSFTGGPTLERLRDRWGVRRPIAFLCLVDPRVHRPRDGPPLIDLGYLGTFSPDRADGVRRLLVEVAAREPDRRFALAGPGHPDAELPGNVARLDHLAPGDHRAFYGGQRFTLNLTRTAMRDAGHSPSVRLFEAAACGVPIISDRWPGIEEVLQPGREILLADTTDDVRALLDMPETPRRAIARRARERVLAEHTAARRVDTLERELAALLHESAA